MPRLRAWEFVDPGLGETYQFRINPNQMGVVHRQRNFDFAPTTGGGTVVYEAPSAPVDWSFSGVCLTAAQYAELLKWSEKKDMLQLTDHFGRIYLGYSRGFEPEHQRRMNRYWYCTYTFRFLILTGPSAPTVGEWILGQ